MKPLNKNDSIMLNYNVLHVNILNFKPITTIIY